MAITFDSQGIAASFVTLRFRRRFVQFMEGIADDDLAWLAQNNRNIVDLMDKTKMSLYVQQLRPHKALLDQITPSMLWHWLPERQQVLLTAIPGGQEWAIAQADSFKQLLAGALL